jgi:hypothetical protein
MEYPQLLSWTGEGDRRFAVVERLSLGRTLYPRLSSLEKEEYSSESESEVV